jgi:hypothetical protein
VLLVDALNPKLLRLFAWSGPALVVVFSVGLIPLARFFPPPSPAADAATIAAIYRDHAMSIRLGCFAMIVGLVFLVPWGIALAAWTQRIPTVSGALVSGQWVCLAVSTALIEVIPTVWAVGAYRPGVVSADVTQTVNDFGWFLLLFAWPPFSLWSILVALAIFADTRARPLFPRWSAYISLWNAILLVPGGLMAFFKVGPFAWNGIMAFYIPLFVFFVWLAALTVVLLRLPGSAEAAPTGHCGHDAQPA